MIASTLCEFEVHINLSDTDEVGTIKDKNFRELFYEFLDKYGYGIKSKYLINKIGKVVFVLRKKQEENVSEPKKSDDRISRLERNLIEIQDHISNIYEYLGMHTIK